MQANTGLISQIREGTAFFEDMFKSHFKALHAYAITIIKDDVMAEEVVQNVFYKLWKNKDTIEINISVSAYLYRAVHNDSLNHLKHERVKASYRAHVAYTMNYSDNASDKLKMRELEKKLDEAMKELPEQCRTIFQMSRFEELKYMQIADRLGISIKTVENQMGKALKLLRMKLIDYLPASLIILLLTF